MTSGEIEGIARLTIHPGKLDEFKRLVALCMESVRTKDSGTLQYDLFFNADETACVVHERYRDSAALIEHIRNLGPTFNDMFKTCSAEGEILGTSSPELAKNMKDSGVKIYVPYLSFKK